MREPGSYVVLNVSRRRQTDELFAFGESASEAAVCDSLSAAGALPATRATARSPWPEGRSARRGNGLRNYECFPSSQKRPQPKRPAERQIRPQPKRPTRKGGARGGKAGFVTPSAFPPRKPAHAKVSPRKGKSFTAKVSPLEKKSPLPGASVRRPTLYNIWYNFLIIFINNTITCIL